MNALKDVENLGKKVQTENNQEKSHLSTQSKASGCPEEAGIPSAKGFLPGQTSRILLILAITSVEREAHFLKQTLSNHCTQVSLHST